jgi:hypothetical protein
MVAAPSGVTAGNGGARVIAYAFEADVHCIACTRQRFGRQKLSHKPCATHDYDENGIDYNQEDREGNLLGPIFATDEIAPTQCGTCGEEL